MSATTTIHREHLPQYVLSTTTRTEYYPPMGCKSCKRFVICKLCAQVCFRFHSNEKLCVYWCISSKRNVCFIAVECDCAGKQQHCVQCLSPQLHGVQCRGSALPCTAHSIRCTNITFLLKDTCVLVRMSERGVSSLPFYSIVCTVCICVLMNHSAQILQSCQVSYEGIEKPTSSCTRAFLCPFDGRH